MESLISWPAENAEALTRADIVRWWEARRSRFNLYVGTVGVVSWFLVLIAGSAAVKAGVDFEKPLARIFGPFVHAFLANICYTLGWVVGLDNGRRICENCGPSYFLKTGHSGAPARGALKLALSLFEPISEEDERREKTVVTSAISVKTSRGVLSSHGPAAHP